MFVLGESGEAAARQLSRVAAAIMSSTGCSRAAELRLGERRQQVVRISRDDARPARPAPAEGVMTDERRAPGAAPAPPRSIPETLVLRGSPARVVRFRRGAIVAIAALGSPRSSARPGSR